MELSAGCPIYWFRTPVNTPLHVGRASEAMSDYIPGNRMRELIRTNDLVVLSCAEAILSEAGIACVVLDRHTGLNAFVTQRLMVESENYLAATKSLQDGGLGAFIYEPD